MAITNCEGLSGSDNGPCPEAAYDPGSQEPVTCGEVNLQHVGVTLAHDCAYHIDPYLAVFWQVRTA